MSDTTTTDLASDPDFVTTGSYDSATPPEAPETPPETPPPAETESEPAADEAAPDKAEAAEEAEDTDPDDRDTRVKRAWAEARQAKREMQRLQREVERLSGERTETADEQVERLANQRAAAMATQMDFNRECNKVFDDGVKQFGDKFQQSVEAFREIDGGLSEPMIRAAMEAGNPHQVLHWLADNLDEAERISKLDPARMGAAVGKVASKLSAPKPVSKVAAPIKPINGAATRAEVGPNGPDDLDEWMRYEDDRVAKRRSERTH